MTMADARSKTRKVDTTAGPLHAALGDLDALPGFEPARTVAMMTHRAPPGCTLRWFVGLSKAGDVVTLEETDDFLAPWILRVRKKIDGGSK